MGKYTHKYYQLTMDVEDIHGHIYRGCTVTVDKAVHRFDKSNGLFFDTVITKEGKNITSRVPLPLELEIEIQDLISNTFVEEITLERAKELEDIIETLDEIAIIEELYALSLTGGDYD